MGFVLFAAGLITVVLCRERMTRPAPQPLATRIYDARELTLIEWPPRAKMYDRLIRQAVDPKSWKQRGGKGDISNSHGMFLVLQTPANQLRVQDVFARLRDAAPSDESVVTLTFDIGDFIDRATASI